MRDFGSDLIIPSEGKQRPLPVSSSSHAILCCWAAGYSGVDFSLDGAVQLSVSNYIRAEQRGQTSFLFREIPSLLGL